ncbi:hypothetical protein EVD33_14145 [Bacteroidales bacterium SW292]|nr:hypothetical protein [Bacteroidales bacterium SW292]
MEQNIHGEYRNLTKIGGPGFCYHSYAQELLNKVFELYNTYHPEYLILSEIGDFMHTMDKEVAFVEYAYQESIKPRSSQKMKNEVCNAIIKANKQIKLDLFRLFPKMKELQKP